MDFDKLNRFNTKLAEHGYVLTNNGILKRDDPHNIPDTNIIMDNNFVAMCKLLDEKQEEGVLVVDTRKNPRTNIMACYGFKHTAARLSKDNIYTSVGQMLSIMIMKDMLYDWKVGNRDCIVKLKLDKKSL